MDTGFDKVKNEQIPVRDSVAFLNNLGSPDFEGRDAMREILVSAVNKRIERTLLRKDGPVIQFSNEPYKSDSSIEHVPDEDTNKGKYILKDSAAFWKMLDERPQDFYTDCLNIVPITVLGAIRDVLIERGYEPEAIDRELTGTVFHDEHSRIKLGQFLEERLRAETTMSTLQRRIKKTGSSPLTKKQLQQLVPGDIPDLQVQPLETVNINPFEFEEGMTGRDQLTRSYSRRTLGLEVTFKYNDEGIDPELVTLNAPVSAGDFLYTDSKGLRDREDFGNGDSQNGIILSTAPAEESGASIRAFGHMRNLDDRDSSLGKFCQRLGSRVLKRGMSMEEYIAKGGLRVEVIKFDYVGLYAALAANLTTNIPKA